MLTMKKFSMMLEMFVESLKKVCVSVAGNEKDIMQCIS